MKKNKILAAMLAAGALVNADAAINVTIDVNESGFKNAAGDVTNGMYWGIVVSENDNVFQEGSYTGFDMNQSGQYLYANGEQTDDYYVFGSTVGSQPQTSQWVMFSGMMTSMTDVELPSDSWANTNFQLIWFESDASAGAAYGMASHDNFVVPADGGSSVPFAGDGIADNLQVAGYSFTAAAVPEPSTYAAFCGLAALAYSFNRRRKNA